MKDFLVSVYNFLGVVGISAIIVAVVSLIINIVVIRTLRNVSFRIECIAEDLHGIRKNEALKEQGKIFY